MTERAPLLSMERIEKRFSGVPALAGANIEVAPGEVHALVGQNGAGKSTLIKILTGVYRADSGRILLSGSPVAFTSPGNAQRGGISTIYQEINLIPYRSVAENVFLGRTPKRLGLIDWGRMNGEADALLRRFDVRIDVTRPLFAYNTAIQQMVAIARAVSFDSKLVIMDEPTSSLADHEVEVLYGVIRQLRDSGVSVIFVSHKLDELYAVCDRVTVMRDGRTVATSRMSDISKLELVAAMLGRDLQAVRASGQTSFHGSGHAIDRTILEAEGVRSGIKVKDARVAVRAGEIVGLAGLLGSGRTELARTIFGADRADGGTIRIDGEAMSFREPAEAIAKGLGFCSEDRKTEGIIPDMSVRENISLAVMPRLARSGVIDTAREREIVDRFIRRLGIKSSGPEQKIRELSGGNQQKVLLARWLCMNPQLLILDEPTRGIDVGGKGDIQSLIRELADAGLGVLMISSEIEEVIEGSERVFVLRDGRTVAELPREALSEMAVMTAMAQGEATADDDDR
jgi:galactofuranose transport system ATP-binding protein